MSSELSPVGEAELVKRARQRFAEVYGGAPAAGAAAPGRVNLIGEHVDYCEGFVLPVALPFLTVVVGGFNGSTECRVLSILADGDEVKTSFPADASCLIPGEPAWANYVKGVIVMFPEKVPGFDAVIISDVPMGSGVSSSASLEVAFFTFLEALTGKRFDPVKKAELCQKAEHEFPGMPCGIMDQYIVTMGRRDHGLLIDCRSLQATQIPIKMADAVILVVVSNVKHQLTGSEYPQRRQQCHTAAQLLNYPSLRSATKEDLTRLKSICDDVLVIKRATHVVEEIARTTLAAELLAKQDLDGMGSLLYQSHESLQHLMEVSCAEVDQLVDIFRRATGVYGARMTGGGFGGCVIGLVKQQCVDGVKRQIQAEYRGRPVFFVCHPSDGARVLRV
ncbi:galactokinase-like [Aricia agestis]|uniref:galactokinase-like n=1 Tax=Aricia agestis TaxID=91739 RepID=UPI001C20AA5C|nr:galactokinase-like [Aricia agestis]